MSSQKHVPTTSWEEFKTPDGNRSYFFNHENESTSWNLPSEGYKGYDGKMKRGVIPSIKREETMGHLADPWHQSLAKTVFDDEPLPRFVVGKQGSQHTRVPSEIGPGYTQKGTEKNESITSSSSLPYTSTVISNSLKRTEKDSSNIWTVLKTKDGREFFYNPSTGKARFTLSEETTINTNVSDPSSTDTLKSLPSVKPEPEIINNSEWQEFTTKEGMPFFFNKTTGETSYTKPPELKRKNSRCVKPPPPPKEPPPPTSVAAAISTIPEAISGTHFSPEQRRDILFSDRKTPQPKKNSPTSISILPRGHSTVPKKIPNVIPEESNVLQHLPSSSSNLSYDMYRAKQSLGSGITMTEKSNDKKIDKWKDLDDMTRACVESMKEIRLPVVKEIFVTEGNYNRFLKDFIYYYCSPLAKLCNTQSLQDRVGGKACSALSVFFGNVELILKLHTKLLEEFETRYRSWHLSDDESYGQIFLHFAPSFTLYNKYVAEHAKSSKLIEFLKKVDEFATVLNNGYEAASKNNPEGDPSQATLESFLIMPVQRVPRYVLLLNELAKKMHDFHPDKDSVLEAAAIIDSVVRNINTAIQQQDDYVFKAIQTDRCSLCIIPFTFLNRCKTCMQCKAHICSRCSMNEKVIPAIDPKQKQRICDKCAADDRADDISNKINRSVTYVGYDIPARERYEATLELLHSEEEYIQNLNLLCNHVITPLKVAQDEPTKNVTPIITPHIAVFFNNLEQIIKLNSQLLTDLKRLVSLWIEKQVLSTILTQFDAIFKQLSLYVVKIYPTMSEMSTRLFFRYYKLCVQGGKLPPHMRVRDLFFLPLRRVNKYHELLKLQQELTDKEHQDYPFIESCIKSIIELGSSINKEIDKFKAKRTLKNLSEKFEGKQFEVLAENRKLLKEGELIYLMDGKNKLKKYFYLFSDVLVWGDIQVQKKSGFTFSVKNSINVSEMLLTEDPSSNIELSNVGFQIRSTKHSFEVYANSVEEKNDWIFDIRSAIQALDINADMIKFHVRPMIFNPAKECSLCDKVFNRMNPQKICKRCGLAICPSCSPTKRKMPEYADGRPHRMCDKCVNELESVIRNERAPAVVMSALDPEASAMKVAKMLGIDKTVGKVSDRPEVQVVQVVRDEDEELHQRERSKSMRKKERNVW